ncbi:hypothetical protein DUNSADRAFT_14889 [Dunaliella salina]|uniref:Secreted protein n=1 Tax=Dunaliella salina TaxID=3046 RepID=A0ABQ7G6J0_DUNSA|nr:hypothetical protein DUNSADRAFT_14889 [Dunaliella salina]|eukprot:KAF5830227.1 hypothetical protein DUNSADRAFT_14889 [Dunaliella salina]
MAYLRTCMFIIKMTPFCPVAHYVFLLLLRALTPALQSCTTPCTHNTTSSALQSCIPANPVLCCLSLGSHAALEIPCTRTSPCTFSAVSRKGVLHPSLTLQLLHLFFN